MDCLKKILLGTTCNWQIKVYSFACDPQHVYNYTYESDLNFFLPTAACKCVLFQLYATIHSCLGQMCFNLLPVSSGKRPLSSSGSPPILPKPTPTTSSSSSSSSSLFQPRPILPALPGTSATYNATLSALARLASSVTSLNSQVCEKTSVYHTHTRTCTHTHTHTHTPSHV